MPSDEAFRLLISRLTMLVLLTCTSCAVGCCQLGSVCFCCLVANACYCGLTVGTAADDCVEGDLLEARLGLAAAKKARDDQLQGAKSSYVSHVS